MLFNSIEFLLFFVIVYTLYLFLDRKRQNYLLLISSYIFYGWWDYRFLSLIFLSTIIDYYLGHKIKSSPDISSKRRFRNTSIIANLGILGIFKYLDFFVAEFTSMLSLLSLEISPVTLDIVLPVGISFYTFQTMSYCWDIYNEELDPIDNFFDFALFVSFFPQLVAGPIERAKHLIPQILEKRKISSEMVSSGIHLTIWGFFKKIVIADQLGAVADVIFQGNSSGSAIEYLIAVFFFTWQIYCDFSGYTDIARGISKLLGFELLLNFNLPYFSKSPAEFWRRWHISLSSWLRDYLYIPLGGSRVNKFKVYRNLMATMVLGGLWHGASTNFVIWGFYQGALLCLHRFFSSIIKIQGKGYDFFSWFITFNLTCFGWLIFRVTDMGKMGEIIKTLTKFTTKMTLVDPYEIKKGFALIIILIVIQIYQYFKKDLAFFFNRGPIFRGAYIGFQISLILIYFKFKNSEFIYFQF